MPIHSGWPRGLLLALGGALCAALTAALYRFEGAVGLALSAPAWGSLLAMPILDGASAATRLVRWLAWRSVSGRYYEHRGRWIDILEDTEGRRYLRLVHVRRVLPGLPSDASFARRPGDCWQPHGTRGDIYLLDDALLDYLAKAQAPAALRLRVWLEREVVLPGRRARER